MKILHAPIFLFLVFSFLSACSTNEAQLSNSDEVQTGTVVSVKRIPIKAEPINPNGRFGVSVGSGGHAGVYGSVDFATIGRILSQPVKENYNQEIIVRRSNGSLVAITQPEVKPFYHGEKIKIILQGNQARVTH